MIASSPGEHPHRMAGRSIASTIATGATTLDSTMAPSIRISQPEVTLPRRVLGDSPGGWPANSWFDAVSVPVCIDAAASCNNRLEGYYYWLFVTDSSGHAGAPFDEIGVTWMQDSFNRAVAEWNTDAPGLGKHTFPAMSPLP